MEIERKFLFEKLPDEQPIRVIRIDQGLGAERFICVRAERLRLRKNGC